MVPRLCALALLCLVALAAAQEIPPDENSTTTEMDMMMDETTAEAPTVVEMTTEPPAVEFAANLSEQYMSEAATRMRRTHFYCLDVNGTQFPVERRSFDGQNTNNEQFYWSIFLQYPVLSYLDSVRKGVLFNVISILVRDGAARETLGSSRQLQNFQLGSLCVGEVFHYNVSTFRESVLINIYFRENENSTEPDRNFPVEDFNRAFISGYEADAQSGNSGYVQNFLERTALVVNVTQLSRTDMNFHPVLTGETSNLPTQRAILLGTYLGRTDVGAALQSQRQPFAENPDPINFGLEPGDIVFAVFGTIFLLITSFLVILGFCIHPFFLA